LGVLMLAVVGQPFYVLFDGYTAIYNYQSNTTYSSIRLYGSLGYAIGALIAGYLTKHIGYQFVFYGSSFFFMMLSLILYWIKPLTLQEELTQKADVKALVKNKNYLKFAIFYVISLSTLFSGDAFLGTYFEFKGLGSDIFGIVTFIGVILEIIVLAVYAKYGKRFKLTYVMLSIVLANVVRFFIFSLDVGNILMIGVSFIRAFTMAGLLFIGIEYMGRNVNKKNITLGIMLYSSLRLLMQAVFVFSGGYFIVSFGYYSFYLVVAIISSIALVFIDYKVKHDIINE
ncbi:MAG: MFS transporter, partial [Acholeplasmataceae bacterium]